MLPRQDPKRVCAKVADWPAKHREAWQRILVRVDLFDDGTGTAAHWSPSTIEKNRKGWGRYQTFLAVNNFCDPEADPADCVTRERVQAYSDELSRTVSPYSHWNRLCELLAVVRAFAPDRDWSACHFNVEALLPAQVR